MLALSLPPETKADIMEIIRKLPRAVFLADDSLGWEKQDSAQPKNRPVSFMKVNRNSMGFFAF